MKFRIFLVPITILAMSWFLFYSVPVSVAATPGANGLPCASGPDYRNRMQGPWDPARFDSDPVGIRYSPRWDIFYYAQCLDPASPKVLQTVLDKVIADGKITKPDCDGGKKITFDSEGNLQLCSDESDSYVGIRGSGANAYWIVGYYDSGPPPTDTPTPTPTSPPTIVASIDTGEPGIFPDVTWYKNRVWLAYRIFRPAPSGGSIDLYSFDSNLGDKKTEKIFNLNPGAGGFPRLTVSNNTLWLAFRDGESSGEDIKLWRQDTGAIESLGPAMGNDPVALGYGYIAWQLWDGANPLAGPQIYRRLLTGGNATFLRKGLPTGISRILSDGSVVTIDTDRTAVPWGLNAWFAGPLTITSAFEDFDGAVGRFNDNPTTQFSLWGGGVGVGRRSFNPHAATDGAGNFAVTTWGNSDTVRIATFRGPSVVSVTPTGPPKITGINPTKTVGGQTVEIYGTNLVESIKLESSDGKFYTMTGDVNNQSTTVSFDVPSDFSAGIYKISVTGPLGSATSPQNLEVTVGGSVFSSPVSLPIPTQGLPTDLGQLIGAIFIWSLSLIGLVIFVRFFYAGFLWFTAAGNSANVTKAQGIMKNAVYGTLVLFSAWLILNTINPDLVKSTLTLPGLGTTSPTPTTSEVPGQPIPAKSLLSDLQAERAKYGATISHEEAGKMLNAVAWKNSADGWGLLKKTGGNNCPLNGSGQPISCDWLVHQPSLLGLDVLGDAPGIDESGNRVNGKASPGWGDGYPVEDSKWVAPVAP